MFIKDSSFQLNKYHSLLTFVLNLRSFASLLVGQGGDSIPKGFMLLRWKQQHY